MGSFLSPTRNDIDKQHEEYLGGFKRKNVDHIHKSLETKLAVRALNFKSIESPAPARKVNERYHKNACSYLFMLSQDYSTI